MKTSSKIKILSSKFALEIPLGILLLAGLVVLLQPTAGHAQQGSAGALLEEIVTVARKRSEAEAVQDVPIAVTAFGATQLDALFVTKLDDLSHLMPNVQLEQVGTFPGVQNFSIRGQGINSSIPSVDPTVGVFVDGVYLGVTFGSVVDMFDLESVEVLRGPQGLLFGRNVTGGAVLLRTKRPGNEFATRFRIGATDEEQYNVAASIEGPLLDDTLSAKLVAYYDDDSGYFRNSNQQQTPAAPVPGAFYFNPANGRNVGEMTTKLIRPTLTWTPTDISEWTLILESGVSEGDGAVWANVSAQRAGVLPEYETTLDEMGFTDMKWTQATLETNIDEVGNGTLTNILGWRRTEALSAVDIDGTNLPIFAATGDTNQHQISNEIRWSGAVGDNWDTTFGLYFFDQDIVYREGRIIQGGAVNLGLGGDMDGKTTGVFWSNDFHFSDDWTATVGVRYTDESKSTDIITAGCLDIITFNCTRVSLSGDWQNVTPKLGIEKSFDGGRVYGFWSKGYRSGGFNFRNARPDVIPPGPTKEEENNTFEIGLKTELGDGRMRLNVAAFYNDIKDMQRELNLPDPFVVVLQGTINAGDVTIKGIEADFAALLTDTFSINLSAGWQDGEYDSVSPLVAQIEAGLGGLTVLGPELPRLAPFNYALGFSWDIPLRQSGLVNLAGNYTYRDDNPYNDSNTEFFDEQKRTNLSINWFSPSEIWQVSLYGKNLSDEPNWGNLTNIAGLFTAGPMQKGRTIGMEINYRN